MIPELIHIFSAGDHYSPKTGSSVPTVIYELSRQHDLAGGKSRVIVGRGTFDGFPPYPIGDAHEVDYQPFPPRHVRLFDAFLGAANLQRRSKWQCYGAACEAIPKDFDGWIIVHGEPAIVKPLKRARPKASIALYCHYDLFRWYTGNEVNRIIDDLGCVICISEYIAAYVTRKARGRRSSKIGIVFNGVDTTRFSPATEVPQGDPTILFVGRVHPDKGVDLLVDAALKLKERGRKFRLKIVGGQLLAKNVPLSEFESMVHKRAKPLGQDVQFLPFVDRENVPDLYRTANIFCAPSVWNEPFGLVVAEAMSAGLPVVASDRGAIPEVGADAALYFKVPDSTDLANQLDRLLADPSLRQSFSVLARKRALELTWGNAYQQLMALIARTTMPSKTRKTPILAGQAR